MVFLKNIKFIELLAAICIIIIFAGCSSMHGPNAGGWTTRIADKKVNYIFKLDSINPIISLASTKNLASFSTAKENAIQLIDPQNGKILRKIYPGFSFPRILAMEPGNFHLAAADSGANNVLIIDLVDSTNNVKFPVNNLAKTGAFIPNSNSIAIGDTMGIVRIYDIQSGQQVDTIATDKIMDTMLKDSAQTLENLQVSKNGKYIAAIGGGLLITKKLGADTTFTVYFGDLDNRGHKINSLQFSPDEQYILAAGSKFSLRINISSHGRTNVEVSNASAGLYLWGLGDRQNEKAVVDGAIFENAFWMDNGKRIAFIKNDYGHSNSGFSKFLISISGAEIGNGEEQIKRDPEQKIYLGNGFYQTPVVYCDEKGILLYELQDRIYAVKVGKGETQGEVALLQSSSAVAENSSGSVDAPLNSDLELDSLISHADELPEGSNKVQVRNPNYFSVQVTLELSEKKKSFLVDSMGVSSVHVPDGEYDIFFEYSNDPGSLYQGDGFNLNDNGIEIQIVKVVNGNYGIKKVR